MTNKIGTKTVAEFMADYAPIYQPIYPLLMGKSQAYSEEVGLIDFQRVDTVGDVRNKLILPKDTSIYQIAAGTSKKSFKKYFMASQFVQSSLQDPKGIETVNAQVLDEHNKQFDELVLLGEGTSAETAVNNGLYWSADPNYKLNSSAAVSAGTDHLIDLYAKIMAQVAIADQVAGRKLIIFYGDTTITKLNGLYVANSQPFKKSLRESLDNYSVAQMPSAITPSSASGFIIINLDNVKLHYVTLPKIKAAGVNEEKMYSWTNYLMGSAMLEILAPNAVIRQPLTYA